MACSSLPHPAVGLPGRHQALSSRLSSGTPSLYLRAPPLQRGPPASARRGQSSCSASRARSSRQRAVSRSVRAWVSQWTGWLRPPWLPAAIANAYYQVAMWAFSSALAWANSALRFSRMGDPGCVVFHLD